MKPQTSDSPSSIQSLFCARGFDSSNSYLGRFPRSDWPSRLETNRVIPLGFGAFRLTFELRAKLESYLRFYNAILHNTRQGEVPTGKDNLGHNWLVVELPLISGTFRSASKQASSSGSNSTHYIATRSRGRFAVHRQ